MKAILKIFSHLLSSNKMVVTTGAKHAEETFEEDTSEKEKKYRLWLQDRYNDSIECLCELMTSDDSKLQVSESTGLTCSFCNTLSC